MWKDENFLSAADVFFSPHLKNLFLLLVRGFRVLSSLLWSHKERTLSSEPGLTFVSHQIYKLFWPSPKVASGSSLPYPQRSVFPSLYAFASGDEIRILYQVLGGALVCPFASCAPSPNYSTKFHPWIGFTFMLSYCYHTLPRLVSFSEPMWEVFLEMLEPIVLPQFSKDT